MPFFNRFSLNMDDRETYLFTTHVQAKFTKGSPKLPNHLVCWDTKKWIPKFSVAVKKHVITEMAVRCVIFIQLRKWDFRNSYKRPNITEVSRKCHIFVSMRKLQKVVWSCSLFLTSVVIWEKMKNLCRTAFTRFRSSLWKFQTNRDNIFSAYFRLFHSTNVINS